MSQIRSFSQQEQTTQWSLQFPFDFLYKDKTTNKLKAEHNKSVTTYIIYLTVAESSLYLNHRDYGDLAEIDL